MLLLLRSLRFAVKPIMTELAGKIVRLHYQHQIQPPVFKNIWTAVHESYWRNWKKTPLLASAVMRYTSSLARSFCGATGFAIFKIMSWSFWCVLLGPPTSSVTSTKQSIAWVSTTSSRYKAQKEVSSFLETRNFQNFLNAFLAASCPRKWFLDDTQSSSQLQAK